MQDDNADSLKGPHEAREAIRAVCKKVIAYHQEQIDIALNTLASLGEEEDDDTPKEGARATSGFIEDYMRGQTGPVSRANIIKEVGEDIESKLPSRKTPKNDVWRSLQMQNKYDGTFVPVKYESGILVRAEWPDKALGASQEAYEINDVLIWYREKIGE